MKSKRFLGLVLAGVLAASFCGALTGCKEPVRDDEQFLEISDTALGYGSDWLDAVAEAFVNDPQIREKYPEVDVKVNVNTEASYAKTDVESQTATADLYFATTSNTASLNLDGEGNSSYYEELTDLYEENVWGEETTMGDKVLSSMKDLYKVQKEDGTDGYWAIPYVAGTMGILYNKTQFAALGIEELPVTTKELSDLCDYLVNEKQKTPFVFSTKVNYWTTSVWLQWWAQYEGEENYDNFFRGNYYDEEEGRMKNGPEVFNQTGRLRALETMYSLIGVGENETANPNNHKRVNTMSWTQAQSAFLLGEGLMMVNGDWFINEMASAAAEGVTDDFGMMRLPVISSVTETLEDTSMKDETLAEIIRAVDAGAEYADVSRTGVSENDFKKIKEARNILVPLGGHVAFIPVYAQAKELAKDFLKFMASDDCCKIFYEKTGGSSPAFQYDVETKDPELYSSFMTMQKERIEMSKSAVYVWDFSGGYPTNYYGGLIPLQASNRMLEAYFVAQNEKDRRTPQSIFDAEKEYWTVSQWKNMMESSGMGI